jgi:peptide/nickel transport system substrate-binding protein
LSKKDSKGFRLLPSGKPFDIEIGVVPQFGAWTDIAQLVVENWADIGVKAHVEVRERTQQFAMRPANELMAEVWNEDTTGFPFSVEPSKEIKRLVEIIDEGKTSSRNRQVKLAKELFRIWADNVWEIGTVGLTPMIQGVLVANDKLRNIPEVAGNDWPLRTPGDTRLEQYFYVK